MIKRVYLDYNATTPLHPELMHKMTDFLPQFGNASSIHWAGRGPKALIRDARQAFAEAVGCSSLEVIFTSGGSEANNLALKGIFYQHRLQNPQSMPRFLVGAMEHPSVQKTCLSLIRFGLQVDVIPMLPNGDVDLGGYERLLTDPSRPPVTLVSHMLANNETGVIFPIKKMARLAHDSGAIFHTDAVQGFGKIPLSVEHLGVDIATFSGHKFYALKGVGALVARKGVVLDPLIHGGGQERHRRGGTENVLAIASLGFVCGFCEHILSEGDRLRDLRDQFEQKLKMLLPGVSVTGGECKRVPNTSSVVISGVDGETLLMNLDMEGYAVSTGAACSSGSPEPSAALLAMGLTRDQAQSSLRISLGWQTTEQDLHDFLTCLVATVQRLRALKDGAL